MKIVITLFIIILISSLLTYPQISEDMWELKLDLTRSVEPALAINPLNGNILVAYMEYASPNPRMKYALCTQDGDIIASG